MPLVARASMMSLGTWSARSTKYQKFLNLSNVFLLITSTILIFCATILISWYHMLKLGFWSPYFYWTPMLMLSLGLYTFLTTCYGFIISVKESRGLITVMSVLLAFAFIGQLASVFTTMMLRTEIETNIPNVADINDNMKQYDLDEDVKANWDGMQRSLRCCGSKDYELGYRHWDTALYGSRKVPDSCCHHESEGCGFDKIGSPKVALQNDIGIWKDGCIEILEEMLKRDLLDFAWIYIGVGLILALVELITVVLACAYVAQISRRVKREQMYTRAATADDSDKYMPGLAASHETNF